jgi:hypothetical protein
MPPGVRRLGAVLAFAVSLGLAGCGSGSQTLDARALQKQAETVESLAAEGALLAGEIADGRTTGPFAQVHAAALTESAQKLVDSLAPGKAKPASGLANKLARVRSQSKLVLGRLRPLEHVNKVTASRLQSRLGAQASHAKQLAESL